MPVLDGHAIALNAYLERSRSKPATVGLPEHLTRFLFHFVFFIGDVGNDIAQNVERCDTGVSRTTHRLHGYSHYRLDFITLVERCQREHEAHRRAVRVADDKP